MGLFKKLSSIFGADTQKEESLSPEKLHELKQQLGKHDDKDKKDEDKEINNYEVIDTSLSFRKGLSVTPNADSRFTCMPQKARQYHIGSGFTVICDRACRFAQNLTKVTIPATIKCIGKSAFSCPNLTEIIFEERSADDELYIKEKAFEFTKYVTSLVLPLGKIKFEGKVFDYGLRELRLQGPPQDFSKETFKSASSLKTIFVDRKYLQQYRDIIGKWYKNIQVEPYLSPEDIVAEKEREEKEREERKEYATLRLHLPIKQDCEIRLGKSHLSKTPTVVSQSYLSADIEVIFDESKSSIKIPNFQTSKHLYWNRYLHIVSKHIRSKNKGKETKWKMADEAPRIARESFMDMIEGRGDSATDTLQKIAAGRDDYSNRYKDPDIEPFWFEGENAETITLEYRLRLSPEEFDPENLFFFSMKGSDIEPTDYLCHGLSRWYQQEQYDRAEIERYKRDKRELKQMEERHRADNSLLDNLMEDMGLKAKTNYSNWNHLALSDGSADDYILWLDFIGYDNQFGTMQNIIWDKAMENRKRYDEMFPQHDEVDDKAIEEEVGEDKNITEVDKYADVNYEDDCNENEDEEVNDENDEEDDYDEEDEELAENLAKPIFIVHLKRINIPLTPNSLLKHKDELANYNSDCLLMRDNTEDTERANCFFGRSFDKLMKQALETLDEWNEDMDEPIVPVLDYLAGIESYNCDIDNDTLRKVAYFIVNGYGIEADDYEEKFPVKDSLVRIISEEKGQKKVKDYLAYPDWEFLDEEYDGWVERMITEHGITL